MDKIKPNKKERIVLNLFLVDFTIFMKKFLARIFLKKVLASDFIKLEKSFQCIKNY